MTNPMTPSTNPARDEAVLDHERIPTWPPLKHALWMIVTGEKLNDGHYINAYQLTDKLYEAALASAPAPASGVDSVACRHEPYLGECAHCGIRFKGGRPVTLPPAEAGANHEANAQAWHLICETISTVLGLPLPEADFANVVRGWAERHTTQLSEIEAMLSDGQGDDDGPQILPDFEPGWSTVAKVEACLHLLEKRRDALMERGEP